MFESKRLVGKFGSSGDYGYVWPSKIINAAGISIIENAASNRNFWEQWHLNFGFNRFDFYTKDKFKLRYRIMPFALHSTVYGLTQWNLSLCESIKTGTFVFVTDQIYTDKVDFSPSGGTLANTIIMTRLSLRNRESVLAHELIHVYQYESFSGINTFLNKPKKKLKINSNWFKIYDNIFYTDFNDLYLSGFKVLYNSYESDFFEKEAYWYQNLYIKK